MQGLPRPFLGVQSHGVARHPAGCVDVESRPVLDRVQSAAPQFGADGSRLGDHLEIGRASGALGPPDSYRSQPVTRVPGLDMAAL